MQEKRRKLTRERNNQSTSSVGGARPVPSPSLRPRMVFRYVPRLYIYIEKLEYTGPLCRGKTTRAGRAQNKHELCCSACVYKAVLRQAGKIALDAL